MKDEESKKRRTEGLSGKSPFYGGVDVGASATKVVLVDAKGAVLARHARKSGVDYQASARECLAAALAEAGAPEANMAGCVATGYGRDNVDFAQKRVTEITCHGLGCYHSVAVASVGTNRGEKSRVVQVPSGQNRSGRASPESIGAKPAKTQKTAARLEAHPSPGQTRFPQGMVIVDIGGQDSKVIRLDPSGNRVDFKMNRKCAAGTGAFLEEIAARLDLPLERLDGLAGAADKKFTLGSFCTVFAKTEILACIRKGERVENIIRGAFQSVVNRIVEMDRFAEGAVVLTGGVVHYNPILARILGETLGREVVIPPHPQFTGALGAALEARGAEAS